MESVPEGMAIPPELEFKPSGMEADQIGVWSKKAIKQAETYGPFLGVKRKLAEVQDDTYSWEIRGPKGRRLFCIDASDPAQGNWMRFVKSARYYEEQNMIAQQENKNIFYKTLREIPAGEELLCWYNSGEPPSEEMHNETLLKEAKAKAKAQAKAEKKSSKKDSSDKSHANSKDSKEGAKSESKDAEKSKNKSKDKTKKEKKKEKKEKSGKKSKVSSDVNKTPTKSGPKSKQSSTDAAVSDETKTKDQPKTSVDALNKDKQVDVKASAKSDKEVDKQKNVKASAKVDKQVDKQKNVKASDKGDRDVDKQADVKASAKSDKDVIKQADVKTSGKGDKDVQMNESSVKTSVPTTLSISDQTGRGSPVVKLTPMDTDGDVKKHLEIKIKQNEGKDLLAADGSLKSPDMPILENMTKEGFLIPSPTKHTTSWSSSNTATTKVVGGVICQEIAPPKISPVLPITKRQGTPVKNTPVLPITKNQVAPVEDTILPNEDAVDEKKADADVKKQVDAKKVDADVEEKLAIQAPDVSSTEESSGAERDVQDEQDKDSHVTSSRSYAQETDNVTKDEGLSVKVTEDSDKVGNDKNTEGKTLTDPESKDRDVERTKESKKNATGVAKKVKKVKKGKPKYKCHVCGSAFGKPVHVKIHQAKKHGMVHGKPASKGKIFVPGKREKIRTRSVTGTKTFSRPVVSPMEEVPPVTAVETKTVSRPVVRAVEAVAPASALEKVADKLHNQKLVEQKLEKTEVKNREPLPPPSTELENKDLKTDDLVKNKQNPEEGMNVDDENAFDENPVDGPGEEGDTQYSGSLLSGSASMIPMMYSSSSYGHRNGKSSGTYQCEFCRRVFRYRTWLSKHLELKHPGQVPTIPYAGVNIDKEQESSPAPAAAGPAPPDEDTFPEEELTPEQIQLLRDNSKGKRLKIFPCSICNRRFSSKTNVRRHKRLIHKILVRPRRTRLPYPEYTVEEEEKPQRMPVPSDKKVGNAPPLQSPPSVAKPLQSSPSVPHPKRHVQPLPSPPYITGTKRHDTPPFVPDTKRHDAPPPYPDTKRHDTPPSIATSPLVTGMRKSRKNKSPMKRSRALHGHSREDFAESYISFPIEQNPNPLSAFMPTKPETFELESAVYNKQSVVHKSAASIKRISEPSMPSPASSPPHEEALSRRTGPPLVVTAVPRDGKTPQFAALFADKPAQKTSQDTSNTKPVTVLSTASRRKPISVTHLHPKVPSTTSSRPQQHVPATAGKSNSKKAVKPIAKFQSEPPKPPSFANPWVSVLKPAPYIPRKPRSELGSDDGKKAVKPMNLLKETPVTQALSASQSELKKLDTFSVLNLKRRVPSPPPLPMTDDGVLDLTVRKKQRVETAPEPPPPKPIIPSEPLDDNQPLDLSSGSSSSTRKYSYSAVSKDQTHPVKNYASSRVSPKSSSYAKGPRSTYEFHHMSPASFGGKEPPSSHGPPKKPVQTVQQMLQHQQNNLLMKVDRESPQQAPMQQQPLSMQSHPPMQPSKPYRPLLPKPSSAPTTSSAAVSPPHASPPRSSSQQLSPHLVAAQVVKQAHAQSALRPILPKPVPGAATPVFIGGKVVAAGSPPRPESMVKKVHGSPEPTPLDSAGFACNVCDVPFASIKALGKHVVIHAQEWPYKCEFCVRLYQDTDELIQHRTQLHHVGKTFSCGVCKRDFAYKSNLKKHQADVHNLTEMNFRELGPKELRAQNYTDPAKIKTGPPELPPPKPERVSFLEQEMQKKTSLKIGKLKIPVKPSVESPTKSTPSPRKTGPINPQRYHPFAHARQMGYLNMLNDPRNQEVLQTVSSHRCTKCSKEFAETAEFHGHIMECALEGMNKGGNGGGSKDKDNKNIDADEVAVDAEKQAIEASQKKMKMKAYTKSKKKAIQLRQSGSGKRQRAKPGLKTYNPQKYTRRRSSASVDDVHACPGCDKKFYFINKLERHMRMCPNRASFKGKKMTMETDSPVDNVVKKGHCCPFCTRQFTYLKSLKKHALTCPARDPSITDPIRMIEDNFQKAQRQIAAERPDVDNKHSKTGADSVDTAKQTTMKKVTAKKRRRKRRTDVIPKPKKRKRTAHASSSSQEEQVTKTTSNPRKGAKRRNTMLIKIGQKSTPEKQQEVTSGTVESVAAKRQCAATGGQSQEQQKVDAPQDNGASDTVVGVKTVTSENTKVNGESSSTERVNAKENNNEVMSESTANPDENVKAHDSQIDNKSKSLAEDSKSKIDHPSIIVPSSAGNLPDQSAKKHVAEARPDQTEDKNQLPNATSVIHSTTQSGTKTVAMTNGSECVGNGQTDAREDAGINVNGNSLKAYPMRNRLQSAS